MRNTGNSDQNNGSAALNTPTPSNHLSLSSLAERIRAKTEQDRQEVEALTQQQFRALSESLNAASKNALNTTETAIQRQLANLEQTLTSRCQTLSRAFGLKCLQAALLTSAIILAAACTGWGLLTLFQNQTRSLRQEIAELTACKTTLEQTAAQLQTQTWGLTLLENEKGRFIVLPPKTTSKTGWTMNQRQAIKLE